MFLDCFSWLQTVTVIICRDNRFVAIVDEGQDRKNTLCRVMISVRAGKFNLKSHMDAELRSFILKCQGLLTWYAIWE